MEITEQQFQTPVNENATAFMIGGCVENAVERAKGIESDSTSFSVWTANADSETHLNQIDSQPCQEQDVAAMPSTGTLTPASASMPDQIASGNRILTEQQRGVRGENISTFPAELAELAILWPRLAPHIKEGLIAMAKAAAKGE